MAGFVEHRDLLMGVAYRVLGRVGDAEDVVQEAWLRWSRVDQESVADPEAFLVTVTTRLAVDRLRREQARRESYVGPWLPEPLLTGTGGAAVPAGAAASAAEDVAEKVVRAESVSLALLVVLETLSPLERAAFVLYEVFELPYGEVASALERSEAAVRQLVSRARTHVRERRPRFDVDPAVWRQATDRFAEACLVGEVEGLMRLLAPEVRLVADGGGKAVATRKVIVGPERVASYLLKIIRLRPPFLRSVGAAEGAQIGYDLVTANAGPAIVVTADGRPIVYLQVDTDDGLVTTCYLVVNPDKLSGLVSHEGGVLRP